LYLELNPPPPPVPTVGFGQLPAIEFPANPGYSYNFVLQTPTGTLPIVTDRLPVYYMPYKKVTLLATDEAKAVAQGIGFTNEPTVLSDEVYQWQMNIPANLTLTMNIINGSFKLNYIWQSDANLIRTAEVYGQDAAKNTASAYLEKINRLPSDIDIQATQPKYLKITGNRLVPAISLSEADVVKVDLYRQPIDELPVVTADPDTGVISMIVVGNSDVRKQVVQLDYNYFPVNYQQLETYPLRSINSAWEQLQQGSGYLAKVEGSGNTLYVRRIYLAYYEADQAQQFMQPVYVFWGDDGTNKTFTAYVPAIDTQWIK
jgi:hypothetical protein